MPQGLDKLDQRWFGLDKLDQRWLDLDQRWVNRQREPQAIRPVG